MKSEEIKKGLKEIKSFIISEIKNEESNWHKHESRNEIEYKSKWLTITIPDNEKNESKDISIYLSGSDSYYSTSYSLKDIGLSKIRFNYLINHNVDYFIRNREKRQKMENLVNGWNNFLNKNKSLNRDKKLDKILK